MQHIERDRFFAEKMKYFGKNFNGDGLCDCFNTHLHDNCNLAVDPFTSKKVRDPEGELAQCDEDYYSQEEM